MALSATLKVSQSALGSSGEDIPREILDELKGIREELSKNTKLQQTGFIGSLKGSAASALSTLLGGGVGIAAAGAGIANAIGGDQRQGTQQLGYASGTDPKTGEQVYFEIDQKSGEILRILTQQQAKDEGILDSKGQILENLKVHSKAWDNVTKDMAKYKDSVMLTEENAKAISVLIKDERKVREKINAALEAEYTGLTGKDFKAAYDKARFNETGKVQNDAQASQQIASQLYPGGVPPSQSLLYTQLRTGEANPMTDLSRYIRSTTPLVDSTAYIPTGK